MKKAIKALWHGIKAVFTAIVDWVATLFGMKENSKYGRVMRRIVSTAFTLVVVLWAVTLVLRLGQFLWWNVDDWFDCDDSADRAYFAQGFSDNLFFYESYCGNDGYLVDSNDNKVLKGISWLRTPMEGDSLVCFSDGSRRGYFHMRDGRLVIPPVFRRAWIFSEGVAAVETDGQLQFIDTTGQRAIKKDFLYRDDVDGYVFHGGHCAVYESSGKHMGLIDHNGDWALEPVYDYITPSDTFWYAGIGGSMTILSFGMDTIIPLTEGSFYVDDSCVWGTLADHTQRTYDLHGNVLSANEIRDVEQLLYDTHELLYRTNRDLDEESESYYSYDDYTTRKAVATCLRYEAESGWYGLMGPDGRAVTPPTYVSIEAIDKDLYLCMPRYNSGVILNSKGQRVE